MNQVLSHCLALITYEPYETEGKLITKFDMSQRLAPDAARELQQAITELNFFTSGETLYHCYQANMQDLLASVLDFAKDYLRDGSISNVPLNSVSLNFSRLTLNLLGMFKSFLDHGTAALKRRYGNDSEYVVSWGEMQSAEYDRSVAYRFFYNLRNYAQHVGMPPLHFSLEDQEKVEGVRVTLEFYRDELLATYSKWSRDAKIDLQTGSGKLPLLPLLDEWSFCFHRLVKHIQTVRSDEIMRFAQKILEVRAEFGLVSEGVLVIMPEPKESVDGRFDFGFRPVPEAKAKEIVERKFLTMLEEFQG